MMCRATEVNAMKEVHYLPRRSLKGSLDAPIILMAVLADHHSDQNNVNTCRSSVGTVCCSLFNDIRQLDDVRMSNISKYNQVNEPDGK